MVVPDAGDGWGEPEIERYVSRWKGRRVLVRRDGDEGRSEPAYPVRVRGVVRV
jgi:alpha-glucosidase